MLDAAHTEKILAICRDTDAPYFGEEGELFLGIRDSHGVFYALLNVMASQGRASVNCLEVGSFAGASALTWSWGIQELFGGKGSVTCLDTWDDIEEIEGDGKDRPFSKEILKTAFEIFKANVAHCPYTGRIDYSKTDLRTFSKSYAGPVFDLIYIDADHSYKAVLNDIDLAGSLLAEGGILCGDDLTLQANQVDLDALREAVMSDVHFMKDPKTGLNYHPGVSAAVWKTFGEVSNYGPTWFVRKTASGWESINLAGVEVRFPPHHPQAKGQP